MNSNMKSHLKLVTDNTLSMFSEEEIQVARIPPYEPQWQDIIRLVAKHFAVTSIQLLNMVNSDKYKYERAMLAGLLLERLQVSTFEIHIVLSLDNTKSSLDDFYEMCQTDSYFADLFIHLWLRAGTHPQFREI